MVPKYKVKRMLNEIEAAESEIKVANDLLNRAKKYLYETPLNEIDADYMDKNFAEPLNNLKHISFQ